MTQQSILAMVRFRAEDVLALLKNAKAHKRDEVWFIRSMDCYLTLPNSPEEVAEVKPAEILGDDDLVFDDGRRSRVEVLDLHNHVLRSLTKLKEDLADWYVEVHFSELEDYCLALCQGSVCLQDEEVVEPVGSLTWMSTFADDWRLF